MTTETTSATVKRIRALVARAEEKTRAAEEAIAGSKNAQAVVLKLIAETAQALEPSGAEGDSDIALVAL